MVWVRFDERFDEDPQVVDAGPLGMALHVAARCYSNRNLTDGRIPASTARRLIDLDGFPVTAADVIARLIEVGMWAEAPGGYQLIHGQGEQPTAADVLAKRDAKAAGGRARAANANRTGGRFIAANQSANSRENAQVTPAEPADHQQVAGEQVVPADQQGHQPVPEPDTETIEELLGREAKNASLPHPDAAHAAPGHGEPGHDQQPAEPSPDARAIERLVAGRLAKITGEPLKAPLKTGLTYARQLVNAGFTPARVEVILAHLEHVEARWRPRVDSVRALYDKRANLVERAQQCVTCRRRLPGPAGTPPAHDPGQLDPETVERRRNIAHLFTADA